MEHGGFGVVRVAAKSRAEGHASCLAGLLASRLALMPDLKCESPSVVAGAHFHLPISTDVPLATRTRHWEPETLSLSD
jgi:hypothetical protein